MKVTDKQHSTLRRALSLETFFESGIFPNGGGSHAHFRKLERMGLLAFDGWGRDIDGEVERDVLCYRLTDKGRRVARSCPPGVPAPDPCEHEYCGPLAMKCIRFVIDQRLAKHPHRWRIVDSLLASNSEVTP